MFLDLPLLGRGRRSAHDSVNYLLWKRLQTGKHPFLQPGLQAPDHVFYCSELPCRVVFASNVRYSVVKNGVSFGVQFLAKVSDEILIKFFAHSFAGNDLSNPSILCRGGVHIAVPLFEPERKDPKAGPRLWGGWCKRMLDIGRVHKLRTPPPLRRGAAPAGVRRWDAVDVQWLVMETRWAGPQ